MNSGLCKCGKTLLSSCSIFQYTPVRHRYYADKIAKGELIRNFGYEETVSRSGHLPRLKDVPKLPMPDYRPKNAWSEKRAYRGQNDYIDILGNGRLNPVQVSYEVPMWMRGQKRGNEMRLLILKKNYLCKGPYQYLYPTAWDKMNKRIRFLYNFMNRKTRPVFLRK